MTKGEPLGGSPLRRPKWKSGRRKWKKDKNTIERIVFEEGGAADGPA